MINTLEHDTALAVEWFENNFMKLNQNKWHLPVSRHKHETVWAKKVKRRSGKAINCLVLLLIEI